MGLLGKSASATASCVIFGVVVMALLNVAAALKITNLVVPEVIQNGTRQSVVLDCDFTFEKDSPQGLVIKWFFNQNPTAVYQWIPGQKPQGLGVLKNRLNLTYRASSEENKAHRALQIMNPTTDLSGEYKCVVSTFASEVSQAKTMVVYVPESRIDMTQKREEGNNARVNIECRAEGVFPEPQMTITKGDGSKLKEVKVVTTPRDGVFDISASVLVDGDDSDESDTSDDADDSDGDVDVEGPTTFECELEIPEAHYTVKKDTVFYPGPLGSTVEPDSNESDDSDDSDESGASAGDAASSSRGLFAWTLLLPLVLFLRL